MMAAMVKPGVVMIDVGINALSMATLMLPSCVKSVEGS